MSESVCEESLRDHRCEGPLYRVEENKTHRVICMGAIKKLIREGHDIEIKKNVPRKFKKEKSERFGFEI